MALIKQSTRQVTSKKRKPLESSSDLKTKFSGETKESKEGKDTKERKRDKKKRFKSDLKAMITETKSSGAENVKDESKSSNMDFKSMLFGAP